MNKNYVLNGLIGFAVGDAVGVPFEFKERGSFKCTDMVGYGTHSQPIGTWSDDTSMIVATMRSIIRCNGINFDDIMEQFKNWYETGAYTPHGVCFDIGGTTAGAIHRYSMGLSTDLCGSTGEYANGNGALMRILPFAFIDATDDQISKVASLTHNTARSNFFCEWYVKICRAIIDHTFDPSDVYLNMIKNMNIDDLDSSGYVVGTFVSALWCFLNTDNYKDCVLTAVNLGKDTDTVAAIAGGLAGLYYGIDAIPTEWKNKLVYYKYLESTAIAFSQVKIY
jgi:ADP-ribosylglycohydrolase